MTRWVHPTEDESSTAWDFVQEQIATHYAMALPTARRRTVVQAGGNIGIFPTIYADYFEEVHTFEPEKENQIALAFNVQCLLGDERRRIVRLYPWALGSQEEKLVLHRRHTRAASHLTRAG